MVDRPNTFLLIVQLFFAGILLTAIVFLLTLLPAALNHAEAQQANQTTDSQAYNAADTPNVITTGGEDALKELSLFVDTTGTALSNGMQSVGSALAEGTKSVGRGTQAIGRGTKAITSGVTGGMGTAVRGMGKGAVATGKAATDGASVVGNAVGSSVVFVLRIPGNVYGFVSDSAPVRAVIRPSEHVEVPIIDPNSPELKAAVAALPPVPAPSQPAAPAGQGPQWPMHGAVTTNFGVPHRPFQHTHSGMDISDGRRSGVTHIKPFRPGKVIETIQSRTGLGNHVIVDHGSGVTSVYAHLYSIAVIAGQEVGIDSVLGTEGSTGASTGTHLHFEIRVNGQAANPRQFIGGNP